MTFKTNLLPRHIEATLGLPNGARFYRCALQVNPFAYLERHDKKTSFQSEDEYNNAIVDTCLEIGIKVIAVTDHYRVKDSMSLVRKARDAGISVFNGFEASTKDGIHFLCLFDDDKEEFLERYIGDCRIYNDNELSPTGGLDSIELLKTAREWGALCIAAHVLSGSGGLLRKLSGQSRANVWKSSDLLACAINSSVESASDKFRPILQNKDEQHKRIHPLAIINASDVNGPEDLKKDCASCFIRMSNVSVEALRQAFLDPESRIRLHSDPQREPHSELLAMTWEGGFLSDTSIHFNENLNVLIGGRGTGKSTVIESIRYVLGLKALGEEARRTNDGIVNHVLKPGTKISLLVKSHKLSEHEYLIERTVPNPPVVKNKNGEVLPVSPNKIIPGVEVFGQHEISELTGSPEKLTFLLERFADRDISLSEKKAKLQLELSRSRTRIIDVRKEIRTLDERLEFLPSLEETHRQFQQAGLEERLKEKSMIIKEERLFSNTKERLEPLRTLHRELLDALPIDTAFLAPKAIEGLPNMGILEEVGNILTKLSGDLKETEANLEKVISKAENSIANAKSRWDERCKDIEERYENLLRELQKSKIDGEEFINLRKRIEELRPLRERRESLERDLSTHNAHRNKLVSEWDDIKASEYRETTEAATNISNNKLLHERIRVKVTMAGDRTPLEQLLRQEVGGRLSGAIERIKQLDQISLSDFARRCGEGKESLMKNYNFSPDPAERISQSGVDLFMRIEELELPTTTDIELNVAQEGEQPIWKTLRELSTGQKATAVLLLLLLESEAPLVIDQPEDDLDNRFITEGVVPIMRQEKQRRQFVFSTHNANIPVLGDSELILGLDSGGEMQKQEGGGWKIGRIMPSHMSSIDSKPVRELVEEILEGGKDAFEMRRRKYGF